MEFGDPGAAGGGRAGAVVTAAAPELWVRALVVALVLALVLAARVVVVLLVASWRRRRRERRQRADMVVWSARVLEQLREPAQVAGVEGAPAARARAWAAYGMVPPDPGDWT